MPQFRINVACSYARSRCNLFSSVSVFNCAVRNFFTTVHALQPNYLGENRTKEFYDYDAFIWLAWLKSCKEI